MSQNVGSPSVQRQYTNTGGAHAQQLSLSLSCFCRQAKPREPSDQEVGNGTAQGMTADPNGILSLVSEGGLSPCFGSWESSPQKNA